MKTRHDPDHDPLFVPLTAKMLAVAPSDTPTPEELLIAKEELLAAEGEGLNSGRRLSPAMQRALLWLGTDSPERVGKLIDWALPLEEAYIVRRYLLSGDAQQAIANDVGITRQGVGYRMRRALWRMKSVQEVAWDLKEWDLRHVLGRVLPKEDVDLLVLFWTCRFSQSRTAERLGTWQIRVREAVVRITEALKPYEDREVKRIHRTLVEVQRRKLWTVAPYKALKHAMRMPG